jgi:hypothetical protein
MKKALLFMLIGAIIIFVWEFISFAMPNFHKAGMEYTPLQDEVLAAIEKSGLEEGMYMLGQPDPELTREEYNSAMEKYEGKPWAVLNYQMNNTSAMALNMIRGFIIYLIIAFLFFWIIRQQKDGTLLKRVLLGVAIGFIAFLLIPYTGFIWFKEPDIWAYLLDAVVPWALLGFVGHKLA